MGEPPGDLDVARHRDLAGRGAHPWVRRGLLTLVLTLPVLALFDVFGQRPSTATARSAGATLSVYAPTAARGGDQFTIRVTVRARAGIADPVLVLGPGWFEQVTPNGEVPEASSETTRDGSVAFHYEPLAAGHNLTVWLAFQINPTDVARRSVPVGLDDGTRELARVDRDLTIFP